MPSARRSLAARVGGFFGVDDAWARPRPPIGRSDLLLALGAALLGLFLLELVRSVGMLKDLPYPWWVQWSAVVSAAVLLLGRRRWPITVALLAASHMLAVGLLMPVVMGQFTLQIMYFLAFLSAVSWARDRRLMLVAIGVIVTVMFAWVALQFAVGNAIQEVLDITGGPQAQRTGFLAPIPASVLLSVFVNVLYFGGAILGGQASWRNARQKELLADQAQTIAAQGKTLRDQAVTEERLRIARELHDVVAHHVSVIGIQAGAARRVLTSNPVAAQGALSEIEASSRHAVSSMRGLLGTLRGLASDADPGPRNPQPTLDLLADLVDQYSDSGRTVTLAVVESRPSLIERLPAPIAHSAYRIVQEALTNVIRHSTANSASVTVRVTSGSAAYLEVEVIDDGRSRVGSSGSGLGHLGIRERAVSHRGVVEIGPRVGGGYRVRVRFPLAELAVVEGAA